MATLIVSRSTDFSGRTLRDIDKIVFTDQGGPSLATFDASQFDGVQIRHDVLIIGNSQVNRLLVSLNADFDASQWQFSSWSLLPENDGLNYIAGVEPANVVGSQQRDVISGKAANDILDGGAQNDQLNGGAGNDRLNGGAGIDTVKGGAGIDVIESRDGEGRDILDGGADEDSLILNRASYTKAISVDLRVASATNIGDGTRITGFESAQLTGGSGNDFGFGGLFTDLMTGGAGNDNLQGAGGDDQVDGGIGRNTVNGGTGNDILYNGIGGTGIMNGGAGNDTAVVDFSNAVASIFFKLRGGGGGLSVRGAETLKATTGAGNDRVTAGDGNDLVSGLGGNDRLSGGKGIDSLDGKDGNDELTGGEGADFLFGNAGIDALNYAASALAVNVNLGITTQSGGDAAGDFTSGFENVIGSRRGDTIAGDGNANRLTGGAGGDRLTGGLGADFFDYDDAFASGSTVSARDVIADFDAGTVGTFIDRIDLSTIDANPFVAGNQKFGFIGGAQFTANTPGQVRVGTTPTSTYLAINLDNDILAEMRIEMSKGIQVRVEDVIL